MTWTPAEFEITFLDGSTAKVCGWMHTSGLAIDERGLHGWMATHIRSGLAVGESFKTRAQAMDFVECVAHLTAWTRLKTDWRPRAALLDAVRDVADAIRRGEQEGVTA